MNEHICRYNSKIYIFNIIFQPVSYTHLPDTGYLNKVKQLCEEYNCLLICDEIQTGMGRTGKFFAVNYDEVVPDIILTAKALGGGIMPIGAFSSTKEIWNSFIESPFLHTSTFGGNPLACSAGIATRCV